MTGQSDDMADRLFAATGLVLGGEMTAALRAFVASEVEEAVKTRQHAAQEMAICAIRYTIGRKSYIVTCGQAWAREWGAKSPRVRRTIIRDLREAVRRCDAGLPDLGDPQIDERSWRKVLAELEAMEADLPS